MKLLEATDLRCGYAGADVLRGVSLEVASGEVVALLGANGSGKTTTLLSLAGELKLTSGRIAMSGEPLTGPLWRRARSGLAVVNDDRSVFGRLSVHDNLKLGRGPVPRALELFPELERLLDRKAGLLSGGEQQMLSVGRAMAAQPRLLLVDELSQGLAPQVVDRLLRAIRDFAASGPGVLMVEQHARKALGAADRAYVLCRGQVVMEGSGGSLLERFDEVGQAYIAGPLS